jgi:hypothetical protein
MAETLISPGVLARENDSSFITQQPVTVGAAIIGPAVKGPVEIPTVVTTYSDYVNRFGTTFLSGGQEYSYLTSIAAYNYFQQGGQSLLVARVASGSFTSATSFDLNASGSLGIASSLGFTTASATLGITPFSASYALVGSSSYNINGINFNFTGSAQADTSTQINIDASSFTTPTTFAAGAVLALNDSSSEAQYTASLSDISASRAATLSYS